MGDDMERQAEIVKVIASDREFLNQCIDALMDRQTTEERQAGSTFVKNGVGLNRADAQKLHKRDSLSGSELEDICVNYTGQLLDMINDGTLVMPETNTAKRTRRSSLGTRQTVVAESDDEGDAAEGSDEEDDPDVVACTHFGIWRGGSLVAPSHQFQKELLRIVQELREKAGRARAKYWKAEEVVGALKERYGWIGNLPCDDDIDIALYLALPPVELRNGFSGFVRVLWGSTGRWATCEVKECRVDSGIERMTVKFIEEDEDDDIGNLSALDVRSCYSIDVDVGPCPSKQSSRKRMRPS